MSEKTPTLSIKVDGIGNVDMFGEGPWTVHEVGRSSYEIRDSAGRTTNPTVYRMISGGSGQAVKGDQNVTYASKSFPNAIVAKANAELGK